MSIAESISPCAWPLRKRSTNRLKTSGPNLARSSTHDIILLDLNLPDMSVFDVLRKLCVSKVRTPILILSGLVAIEDKI